MKKEFSNRFKTIMCDPRSAKLNLSDSQFGGTLLQMSRMMPRNAPVGKRSAFSDLQSSDEEEEEAEPEPSPPLQLQTLQSLLQLKKELEKKELAKPRVQEREIPSTSVAATYGVDPNLFKMIYNLGYDAGLDKRDPIPPCEVCAERRRKNRIAAAEQRKRQREEEDS